jgi:hypothetical protein
VFCEHLLAEGIDLNLPAALHASTLQAEIDAADTSEEGTEGHAAFPSLGICLGLYKPLSRHLAFMLPSQVSGYQ